jgi:hypothetical protein
MVTRYARKIKLSSFDHLAKRLSCNIYYAKTAAPA